MQHVMASCRPVAFFDFEALNRARDKKLACSWEGRGWGWVGGLGWGGWVVLDCWLPVQGRFLFPSGVGFGGFATPLIRTKDQFAPG